MKILWARKPHSICVWVLRIKLWCQKVFRKALFRKISQYLWKKFSHKKTKELFFRKREFVNTLFKFFRLFFPKRFCWCHNCPMPWCLSNIAGETFLQKKSLTQQILARTGSISNQKHSVPFIFFQIATARLTVSAKLTFLKLFTHFKELPPVWHENRLITNPWLWRFQTEIHFLFS